MAAFFAYNMFQLDDQVVLSDGRTGVVIRSSEAKSLVLVDGQADVYDRLVTEKNDKIKKKCSESLVE